MFSKCRRHVNTDPGVAPGVKIQPPLTSKLYFSSTISSDSRTYRAIGSVLSILTCFIDIGAVIILGAVAGAVWEDRRTEMQPERGQPRTPRTG